MVIVMHPDMLKMNLLKLIVIVYDMTSYESSMQSLYPPAWNCLPRFSANKVTGKTKTFSTTLRTCNLAILCLV